MMEINWNTIVINYHPYEFILIIFITIHMILNVAWEIMSIILVCEIGDRAAHLHKHSGGHKLLENAAREFY